MTSNQNDMHINRNFINIAIIIIIIIIMFTSHQQAACWSTRRKLPFG